MHLPGERQLQPALGDPSSHSLWGNINGGCFCFISFLARGCLFGPLFPWDCLHFSVLCREGFIQTPASPFRHTTSLHISALLNQESPMASAAALAHPSSCPAPWSTASQQARLPGAVLAAQQPAASPACARSLHREASARHKSVNLEQCNAVPASAGELSRAWLWIITAT